MSSFSQPAAALISADSKHPPARLAPIPSANTVPEPASETKLATRPSCFSAKDAHLLEDREIALQDQPAQIATQALASLSFSGPGTEGTGEGHDQIEDPLAIQSRPRDSHAAPFATTALSGRSWVLIGLLTNWLTRSLNRNDLLAPAIAR
jgi:hypothetical protein